MLRRILTILSLIGLLLSMAAWWVSYACPLSYRTPSTKTQSVIDLADIYPDLVGTVVLRRVHWTKRCTLRNGVFVCSRSPGGPSEPAKWSFGRAIQWTGRTPWLPSMNWPQFVMFPLWIPTLLFSALLLQPLAQRYRRRKRKKLGLCIRCGYDLRGSKERCPECGGRFEMPKLDADC